MLGLNALEQMLPLSIGKKVELHAMPRNSQDGITVEGVLLTVRIDALIN